MNHFHPCSLIDFFSNDKLWKKTLKTQAGLNTYFIGMNCKKKPCSDKRIRQAICHAIKFDLIVNTTRKDQAVRAYGPIPPGIPGYSKDFKGISSLIFLHIMPVFLVVNLEGTSYLKDLQYLP